MPNYTQGEYIPLDECKNDWLYRIDSRNLVFGVFTSRNDGFVGIREKFGERYLFTEYHWDKGAPFGTVRPREKLEQVPESVALVENLGQMETTSKRLVTFVHAADGQPGKWVYCDDHEPVVNIGDIRGIGNKALFDWLKEREKKLLPASPISAN